MSEFQGKTVVISGGSRGIGAALVLKFASLGANVAFSFLSNKKEAQKFKSDAEGFGVKVSASQVDIKDFEKVKNWIEEIRKELGQIDLVINNAGITIDKPLMMMSEEDWRGVIDTNLNGMYHLSKACIVGLMKQRSGNIVNISSVSGIIGLAGQTNYSASKGGMNGFTKALAKEVAGHGIRVNAVAPGFIDTDIISNIKPEQLDQIKERIPVKRLGSSEEVAAAVVFLASERAKYITGQVIQVDGGLAIR